jgi:hypothetical protein
MIEILIAFLLYIALSIVIASKAKNSHLSFTQLFLVSFFLTPVTGITFLIKTKKRFYYHVYQYRCPKCNYYFTEKHTNCAHCEEEGYKVYLKKVKKIMT